MMYVFRFRIEKSFATEQKVKNDTRKIVYVSYTNLFFYHK